MHNHLRCIFSTLEQEKYNEVVRKFIADLHTMAAMPLSLSLPNSPTSAVPEPKKAPSPPTLRRAMAIAGKMLEKAKNSGSSQEENIQADQQCASPLEKEIAHDDVRDQILSITANCSFSTGSESIAKYLQPSSNKLLRLPSVDLKTVPLLCNPGLRQPCEKPHQSDVDKGEQC